MANLETLELTINGSAEKAASGIDNLIAKLAKLSEALIKPYSDLRDFNAELAKTKSMSQIKFSIDGNKAVREAKTTAKKVQDAVSDTVKVTAKKTQEAMSGTAGSGSARPVISDPEKEAEWTRQLKENTAAYMAQREAIRKATIEARERIAAEKEAANAMKQTRLQEAMALVNGADKAAMYKMKYEEMAKAYFMSAASGKLNSQQIAEGAIKVQTAREKYEKLAEAQRSVAEATEKTAKSTEMQAAQLEKVNAQTERLNAQTEKLKAQTEKLNEETASIRQNTAALGNTEGDVNKLAAAFGNMLTSVSRIAKTMLIRTAIRAVIKGAKEGLDNFYKYAKSVGNGYAEQLSEISSKWKQIKNQMGATLGTALAAVIPILKIIADVALIAFNALSALFALLQGKDSYTQATYNLDDYTESVDNAKKANKDLLASFDELNVITQETTSAGSNGNLNYENMFQEVQLPQWLIEWKPIIEAILAGILGATILPAIFEWIKKIFGLFAGESAVSALDTLSDLLGDHEFNIDGLGATAAEMGILAAACAAASAALPGVAAGLSEVETVLTGFSAISGIISALTALLTSLAGSLGGTITIKVDDEKWTEWKEDYKKWLEDNTEHTLKFKFDVSNMILFDMIFAAIGAETEKMVKFTFDVSDLEMLNLISSIVGADEEKKVKFKFDIANAAMAATILDIVSADTDKEIKFTFNIANLMTAQIISNIVSADVEKKVKFTFDLADVSYIQMISDIISADVDKKVNFTFDITDLATIEMISGIISADVEKKVKFTFSITDLATIQMISSIIGADVEKKVKFTFSITDLATIQMISSIVGADVTKKVKFSVDISDLETVEMVAGIVGAAIEKKVTFTLNVGNLATIAAVSSILTADADKNINLKLVDNADVYNTLNAWVEKVDSKVINLEFKTASGGQGTGQSSNDGGSWLDGILDWFINDPFWNEPIWDYVSDTDFWSKPFWEVIADWLKGDNQNSDVDIDVTEFIDMGGWDSLEAEAKKQLIASLGGINNADTIKKLKEKLNLSAYDIIIVSGFDKLEESERKQFVTTLTNAYGSQQAISDLKKAIPNLSASELITLTNWEDVADKEGFIAAMKKEFGEEETIKALKQIGVDISDDIQLGLDSKEPVVSVGSEVKAGQTGKDVADTFSAQTPSMTVTPTIPDDQKPAEIAKTFGAVTAEMGVKAALDNGSVNDAKKAVENVSPEMKAKLQKISDKEAKKFVETVDDKLKKKKATINAQTKLDKDSTPEEIKKKFEDLKPKVTVNGQILSTFPTEVGNKVAEAIKAKLNKSRVTVNGQGQLTITTTNVNETKGVGEEVIDVKLNVTNFSDIGSSIGTAAAKYVKSDINKINSDGIAKFGAQVGNSAYKYVIERVNWIDSYDIRKFTGSAASGIYDKTKNKLNSVDQDYFYNFAAWAGYAVKEGIKAYVNALKFTFTAKDGVATLTAKAGGGLVTSGDIFIANENGKSEMIGRFGNQTGVANQEQMVEAMARGVAYAQESQNALLREQNNLLRGILQKDNTMRLAASSALGRTVRQSLNMYDSLVGG